MAKSRSNSSPAPDEIVELREEITSLKDHIRVLVDDIDEVREELSWLTRNGFLPSREPLPPVPVLKRMAADPCADDWGERLVIERGGSEAPSTEAVEKTVPPPVAQTTESSSARPGHLF